MFVSRFVFFAINIAASLEACAETLADWKAYEALETSRTWSVSWLVVSDSKRPAERFRPADVVAVQHEAGEPQEFWTVAKGARVKHRPVAHDEAALEDGEETPGASSDDEGDEEDDAWAEEAAEPAGGPDDVRDEEASVVGQRFQ